MKTLHTQGPWVARRDGAVGPTSKEDDQSFGMLLPVAYVEDSDWPESADANARLISAAPEMYAALVAAEARLRSLEKTIDGAFGDCRSEDELEADKAWPPEVYTARAAIAKATGEQA